jgi:hypothetical protein
MTSSENRPLVGGIVLASSAVLALLAVLCWSGVLPVGHDRRTTVSMAFGLAAVADAAVGLMFLTRSRQS